MGKTKIKRRTGRKQKRRKTRRVRQKGGNEAYQTFFKLCRSGNLEEAQEYLRLNPTIDISALDDEIFRLACRNGQLHVAQWLLQVSTEKGQDINISANNEEAFRCACMYGHLELAQWLLQVSKERGQDINISALNEFAFWWACSNGHLEVAQWLHQVKPMINISAKHNEAFRKACQKRHLEVAQWLSSLKPEYEIVNEDRPDWSCRVLTDPEAIARRKRENNLKRRTIGLHLMNTNEKDNLYYALPTDVAKIATSYLG
jgi:hypothetical protein